MKVSAMPCVANDRGWYINCPVKGCDKKANGYSNTIGLCNNHDSIFITSIYYNFVQHASLRNDWDTCTYFFELWLDKMSDRSNEC